MVWIIWKLWLTFNKEQALEFDETDDSYLQSLYFAGFLVNRLIFRSLLSVSVLISLLQFIQVSVSAFTRTPIASCPQVSVFSMVIL